MKRGRMRVAVAGVLLAVFSAPASHGDSRQEILEVIGRGARLLPDGHYALTLADGTTLHTHGPDPKPNHGSTFGPGDPERAPLCATDYYQHVLYGRPTSAPSRYASVKGSIQAAMRRMNAVLNEASLLSGDKNADYKVKCDDTSAIQVDEFTAPAGDFDSIVDAARAQGFAQPNVDYTIFWDDQPTNYCGIANVTSDERLTQSNFNNSGGDYAVAYADCWFNETPMHENAHNQGAVQSSAPYSTGSGAHCIDDEDVMCYSPDGGNQNQGGVFTRCSDRIHFDCGNDTYFDSEPEPGEWLASHWNIGSALNRFIAFGAPLDGPPSASLAVGCGELTCRFSDTSVDDGAIVTWAWHFGDGQTSAIEDPVHTYSSTGTYLVTLTVTDDEGETASSRQTVRVPNTGDPDSATQTLNAGEVRTDQNGPMGSWKYYKVYVPPGGRPIQVSLDGPSCPPFFCNPDLDLYVRQGQRPDAETFDCRSYALASDEACSINAAAGGYWYVGVHTSFATPNVVLPLSTATYTVTFRY